jgi:ABC-2 type transport system permease protein
VTPYLAIVGARFRMLLQYRAAAIAGLGTQIFFGMVLIMIYEAFYRSARVAPPIAFRQIVSYVWLGQALFAMLPWNSDPEWRSMVRSGAIAYELCRPVDLYGLAFAREIARRTAPTLLRAVPMVVIATTVLPLVGLGEWRLAPPPDAAAGISFAASLLCTIALGCAIGVLVNITVIWTISSTGHLTLLTTAVTLFSGMIIPLPLFPDWAQRALAWSPFAGLMDLPFRIYSGHIATADVPLVLARQLGWTLVLVVFGRWLLRRGLRRVVVLGG